MRTLTEQERDEIMDTAVNAMAQLTFRDRTEVLNQVGQIIRAREDAAAVNRLVEVGEVEG